MYRFVRLHMLFLAALCALPGLVSAQTKSSGSPADGTTSRIIGQVISSQNGEPLAYTNVSVFKAASAADTTGSPYGGAMTATDGGFRVPCAPGHYVMIVSYIGFRPKRISGIEVKDGLATTQDVALLPSAMQIETIQVEAKADRASEAAILAKQKKAAAVSDGISSPQIKKTPDANAADVLRRVTGVSTVGGRYVYVRGLGERYSATQVNGSTLSTPEPNKKVVPLDIFSAGLLENVVIQKTYTAEQPGEFAGGVVNLSTRDFPGTRIWDVTVTSGVNSAAAGNGFQSYAGGDRDFLGFDDGTRGFPGLFEKLAGHKKLTSRGMFDPASVGFSSDTLAMLGTSFSDTWKTRSQNLAATSYGVSATYGNEVTLLNRPFGLIASFTQGSAAEYKAGTERVYISDGSQVRNDFEVGNSERAALWGALVNGSYRLTPYHTLSLRTMYNRSAEDEVRVAEGYSDDFGLNLRSTRLQYVERGIATANVGMNHFLAALNGGSLEWKAAFSNAVRNEPDHREYVYEERSRYIRNDDDMIVDTLYTYQLSERIRPTRQFGEMGEDDRTYEVSLAIPFRQWGGLDAKLKTGVLLQNRDRSFAWRRFTLEAPNLGAGRDSIFALEIDELLDESRIGGPNDARSKFWLIENTGDRDSYLAHQNTNAGYVTCDIPVSQKLRAVLGGRLESATLVNDTFDPFSRARTSHAELDDTDFLPALNLTYSTAQSSNVRAAYSRTVSRPDLRELSDFFLQDVVTRVKEVGNADLKRAMIHNFDLRFETYPSTQEIFAISAFHKSFDNAIERSMLAGADAVIKPVNAKEARLTGAEIEGRVGLKRVSKRLTDLSASGNVTLVNSEAKLDPKDGVQFSDQRPLEGQSPYVVNAGLYYQSSNGRANASVLYNRFGRRLYRVGLFDLPDVYEEARGTVDVTMSRSFRDVRLKLSGKNLLDDESKFAHDGAGVTHLSTTGRSVSFSVSKGS